MSLRSRPPCRWRPVGTDVHPTAVPMDASSAADAGTDPHHSLSGARHEPYRRGMSHRAGSGARTDLDASFAVKAAVELLDGGLGLDAISAPTAATGACLGPGDTRTERKALECGAVPAGRPGTE